MLPFPAAGWAPSLPTSGMQHGSGPWSSQVSSIPHHTQCYIPNRRLANRITMEFPPRLKAGICFGSSCCIWISTSWLKQVLQRQKPAKRAADAQACREADSTQETNKPSHTWASKLCRLHTLKFSAFSPKITCAHRSFSPASSPSPWSPPCAQLFVNKITSRCLNPRHSLSPNKHCYDSVISALPEDPPVPFQLFHPSSLPPSWGAAWGAEPQNPSEVMLDINTFLGPLHPSRKVSPVSLCAGWNILNVVWGIAPVLLVYLPITPIMRNELCGFLSIHVSDHATHCSTNAHRTHSL